MDESTVRLVKQDLPVLWEDVLKESVLSLQSNEPALVWTWPFLQRFSTAWWDVLISSSNKKLNS